LGFIVNKKGIRMELKTAIEILEYHQEWRLGKREDMIHEPKKLTEAIDVVLEAVNEKTWSISWTDCPTNEI
jgi:hypothetical protein